MRQSGNLRQWPNLEPIFSNTRRYWSVERSYESNDQEIKRCKKTTTMVKKMYVVKEIEV